MTGRHRGPPASAPFVTAIRILGPAAAASHLPAPENTSRPSGSVPGLARAGTARRRRRRCRCRRGEVAEQAVGTSSGQILIRGRGGDRSSGPGRRGPEPAGRVLGGESWRMYGNEFRSVGGL